MVYLVTWELNREKPNYSAARDAFITHLEKLKNKKDVSLDTVRFIATTYSALELKNYLRQKMDDDDRIVVVRMYEYSGWLSKDVWEWIDAQ